MPYQGIKRRVFISHYKGDRGEVDEFIDYFANQHGVFTPYVLGANDNYDFIDSTNTDYVMTQVRKKYLQDTTVTIVLMGSCTHSRRYVDWEIKTSLRQGDDYIPNGLVGILVSSQGDSAHLPRRFEENWDKEGTGYTQYWSYPSSVAQLGVYIENAHAARTSRAHLIKNSQDMMKNNGKCEVCNITH